MTTKMRQAVDQADVDALLALEPKVSQLLEDIAAATPAAERLAAAEYAGAGWVLDQLGGCLRMDGAPADGDPRNIARALEAFRVADGDLAALDYHRLIVQGHMTLPEAADEVYEGDFSAERVEAFRRYAEQQAEQPAEGRP